MTTKRNNGRWTEARYKSFIRSALRGAFRKWPPKFDVLKKAFVDKRINPDSGRLAAHYRCAGCNELFVLKNVQVDHIKQIGKLTTWDIFINKLFCEAKNLQVLCKPCHATKTKKERKK